MILLYLVSESNNPFSDLGIAPFTFSHTVTNTSL